MLTTEGVFRELVKEFLHKSCIRRAQELNHDLFCVHLGLKPSLLFDIGAVTSQALQDLLERLRTLCLITERLCILNVGEDVMICNIQLLKSHLNSVLGEGGLLPKVVDISKNLKKPQLLNCVDSKKLLSRIVSLVLELLSDRNGDQKNGINHTDIVTFRPLRDVNVTTLFGLCLGYPVIYYFDNTDGNDDHCLDMEPLVCDKVYFTHTEGNSYLDSRYENCSVFSFSYPEILHKDLAEHTADWFRLIKTLPVKNYQIELKLEQTVRTLAAVSL